MSRIYRALPPKGTRLAIAYSGGLDTRCAVAWLAEQGMDVYADTADLAQPDEAIVADIEEQVKDSTGRRELPEPGDSIKVRQRGTIGLWSLARTIFADYRQRAIVAFSLFVGQAFLYNAVFFTYALILTDFYDISGSRVGLYLIPFAIGNFLGPILLGSRFDRWGRRVMIPATYALSGVFLLATGALFVGGYLDAVTQTIAWSIVFFFASADAPISATELAPPTWYA